MAKPDCLALAAHPKEVRQQAFELFKQGKPYVDIAYELRVPAPTLRAWSRRERWRERAEVMKAAPEVDFEASIQIVEKQTREADLPIELAEQQTAYEADMRRASLIMSKAVAGMPAEELIQKADKIAKSDAVARKALRIESERPHCAIQIALLSGQQQGVALRNRRV